MNNQFSLNIKTPCIENFNKFTSTKNGGFCNSCQKEVIDFTKMDSQEIINYFQTKKTQNTCRKFHKNQLNNYEDKLPKKKRINFLSGIGLTFLSLFSFSKVYAQDINNNTKTKDKNPPKFQDVINKKNIVVKGTVTDDMGPLFDVIVLLEGTNIGTVTDFDGNFEFPEKLKGGDVLVFSMLGMNSKKVIITNQKSTLNITLKVNLKMDSCMLMGEVVVKKIYKSKKD